MMSEDRSYIGTNARELARMRALVGRLGADELRSQVNEFWTVAGVLGHIAFWDGRALALADKLERGLAAGSQHLFSSDDDEPGEIDWINDATRPLIHAVPPEELAHLSLEIAEETDARVAQLPPEHMWPQNPESPLNAVRASHRGEHLDDIEAALGE
jgi:DinB family protein